MGRVMILMPNGYEEIEALTVVDFCRRAGIEIDMVSITGKLDTVGDHKVIIKADKLIEDINPDDYKGVITPGGMDGTNMLVNDERAVSIIKNFFEGGKLVANICASPMILQKAGVANKIKGTMYPTLEKNVDFMEFIEEPVVRYENVITSRGPATSTLFAYEIISYLKGVEVSERVMNETLAFYIKK